jgi:hypothetical protein
LDVISIEAVLFVSLMVLLGLTMIFASGPLARLGAKTNFFLPDDETVQYQRRKKRQARQYGIFVVTVGVVFAIYFFLLRPPLIGRAKPTNWTA